MLKKEDIISTFTRYARENSQSDALSEKRPTTDIQIDLLKFIEKDLRALGLTDIKLLDNRRLRVRLEGKGDSIAFLAHVDTASDVKGNDVKPLVWENYDGKDIKIGQRVIKVEDYPYLKEYKGKTLITSSGDTLLGADDKAGVTAMVIMIKALLAHPEFKRPNLEFFFTTDEEVGFGMDDFDLSQMNSKVAFTIDGTQAPYVEAECFNAASVNLHTTGKAAHLGYAKDKMVNALTSLIRGVSKLDSKQTPENTEGLEGYYCLYSLSGDVENAKALIEIRDFDYDNLLKRIEDVKDALKAADKETGSRTKADVRIKYKNMKSYIDKNPDLMKSIYEAGKKTSQKLEDLAIRGGTDGSRLSEMGIPTPNLYTGARAIHTYYEHLVVEELMDSIKLSLAIINWWAK